MHHNNPRSFWDTNIHIDAADNILETNIIFANQNLYVYIPIDVVWQVSVLLKTNKTTLESVKAFMKEPHPQLS